MTRKELIEAIVTYTMKIEQLYSEWAKKQGISYHTLLVLYALRDHSPCTQKEISEKWLLPKQTVHTIVQDLLKKEYVTLQQGKNQKEKLVTLTSRGFSYIQEMTNRTEQLENTAFQVLSLEEDEVIYHGLKKFAEAFESELNTYGK